MPPKKMNGHDDRRVLVDREEHAALLALKEADELRVIHDAKADGRLQDLRITCTAQARRLADVDLIMQQNERIIGLQRVLIDALRTERPQVGSLEDLSTFWRAWFMTTEKMLSQDPKQREEISKVEPDLFRSWKLWVRDAGRASRTLSMAGVRAEIDAQQAAGQQVLQEQITAQLRTQASAQATYVQELEAQLEAYRSSHKNESKP